MCVPINYGSVKRSGDENGLCHVQLVFWHQFESVSGAKDAASDEGSALVDDVFGFGSYLIADS
jgi:hypothetical protein